MYKAKYIKYLIKMKGGYMCNICFRQGNVEITSPNELNECINCGTVCLFLSFTTN